jgi:hypothetical protein
MGGWVDPRAFMDAVLKRKIPSPLWESNPGKSNFLHENLFLKNQKTSKHMKTLAVLFYAAHCPQDETEYMR